MDERGESGDRLLIEEAVLPILEGWLRLLRYAQLAE